MIIMNYGKKELMIISNRFNYENLMILLFVYSNRVCLDVKNTPNQITYFTSYIMIVVLAVKCQKQLFFNQMKTDNLLEKRIQVNIRKIKHLSFTSKSDSRKNMINIINMYKYIQIFDIFCLAISLENFIQYSLSNLSPSYQIRTNANLMRNSLKKIETKKMSLKTHRWCLNFIFQYFDEKKFIFQYGFLLKSFQGFKDVKEKLTTEAKQLKINIHITKLHKEIGFTKHWEVF
ncbi:hypothetical protein pb186bvf_001861 [Paramecium bursaria]